jgi:Subtilase family/Putative peptidoglycan binding domain
MRQTVFASLALLLAAGGTAAGEDRIMVRATSVLPDAVGAELMKIGQPLTITIAANTQVEPALQDHCGGAVSNQYRVAFAALNPGSSLLPASTSRDLQFPACARVARMGKTNLPVSANDTPESFLDRVLGAKLDTKLLICQSDLPNDKPGSCRVTAAQDVIAPQIHRPPDGSFDGVNPPVTNLWLPFRSSWTTIVLNADVTPADAMQRLKAAAAVSDAGEGLLDVAPSPPVQLLAPLSSNDPSLAEGPCSPGASVPVNWPFDRTKVLEAIEAALGYIASRPDRAGRGRATVIRVADTGVSDLGQASGFPLKFLAVNPNAKPGKVDPATQFKGAYYGIDADGGGDVTPRPADATGWHGTQVADLALGGVAFRTEYPALAELVNLSVARIFTDRTGAGIWVNTATLNSSVSYHPPAANIINFSVGGPDPFPAFHDALASLTDNQQLVVLAAGNDGHDLGNPPTMYPAAFASDDRIRSALLVVGAHGPAPTGGMPARVGFSNYGVNYVDLLAPGCRFPPAFGAATGGDLAGTSFAAPLVAFTAGLIRDFLYQPDSRTMRERVWASVRWVSPDVEKTTRFGGVLDIPAAISVFDDVARLRGGALLPGRWMTSSRFQPCGDGNAVPSTNVLRVRVEPRGNALPLLHLLVRDTNSFVSEAPACTAANDDGPQLRLESGEARTLHWSELEALIPAVDADNRRISAAGAPLASVVPAAQRLPASVVAQAAPPIVAPTVTPAANVTSQLVGQIQTALKLLDPNVTADGIAGPATRNAIRQFQRTLLDAPTGTLSAKQFNALLQGAGG